MNKYFVFEIKNSKNHIYFKNIHTIIQFIKDIQIEILSMIA